MKKEAFQEIAKHFAESIKVNLRFEEGACPATNGSEIVLPTEMSENYLDETLGALLHETNHIRYTDMAYFSNLGTLQREVTNVLEDIRVDNRSLKTYPNSRCFYVSLVDDVLNRCKEQLEKESFQLKILKSLVLLSVGFDIEKIYGRDEHWNFIKDKVNVLLPTVSDVINCTSTKELEPHVLKVIKEVFGDQPNEKSQQQTGSGNPEDVPCNGGNGGEGANQDEQNGLNDVADMIENYTDTQEKYNDLSKEKEVLEDEMKSIGEQYSKAKRSYKTYQTKARKLRYYGDMNNPEQKEKLDYYDSKSEERQKEMTKLSSDYSKTACKKYKVSSITNDTESKLETMRYKIDTLVTSEFTRTGNCNLLGFNALDNDKLKDKNYVNIPYNQTLDELIKETLILKQEEYFSEETGKLNSRYLHEIYTDAENIFQEKDEKKIKTKVALVMDVSGSMDSTTWISSNGEYSYGKDSRHKVCLNVMNVLASSFSKAISQGAPGDMSIYVFGTDVGMIKDTVSGFIPINYDTYYTHIAKYGGNTNLSKAVNHVVNDLSSDPEYRNVMILVTDAEVNEEELQKMVNNISTSDVRVMYIAIGSTLNSPAAKELFGENNIEVPEDAIKIMQDVMFRGLQLVS